jgi:hypothetical protein
LLASHVSGRLNCSQGVCNCDYALEWLRARDASRLIDKRTAYEASVRVPMIVQCPELFPGGRTVEQVVADLDIAPAILSAAGLQPPAHMAGAGLLPLAHREQVPWRTELLYEYYWERNFPHTPTVFALRTGDRSIGPCGRRPRFRSESHQDAAAPRVSVALVHTPGVATFLTPRRPGVFLGVLAVYGLLFVGARAPGGLPADRASAAAASALDWPAMRREHRPWTRWWWPGSAVDASSLTHQLEQLAAVGFGGVEITPIYGAQGYEARDLAFLGPEWLKMLEHTGREAQRLGLGVDMATGTGWPFGGPWLDETLAAAKPVLRNRRIAGEPTRMMVKRAAPGGEGLVVDPFSQPALLRYLAPFDRAFGSFPRGLLRGQFHDSFEYYEAAWTDGFADAFREMHGYDVQRFAAELTANDPALVTRIDRDTLARIKADYRETLARLHLEFLRRWVRWAHEKGWIARNQSHGAPANLLDLYAAADIPETETFGSTPFPIPGLRREDDEVRHDQDVPEPLVIRMASSAAHVAGHPLTSSETFTWLRDHWKVSLAYTKPEVDRLFVNGINHVFFHGTVFSPRDAAWPGWLFYASTQFHPHNTWWAELAGVNQYIARVQSILQGGAPDNDILLYWPVADLWDDPAGPLAMQLGVHHVQWLTDQPVGRLARALLDRGYGFDYISDAQLADTRAENGEIVTPGARYAVLVVPPARRIPVATLQRIVELAAAGGAVIVEALPEDVPGYGRLDARRPAFKAALGALTSRATIGRDVLAALERHRIPREAIVDAGVSVARRATDVGHDYFFANLGARAFDGWATLGVSARTAAILDPLTGARGAAAVRATDQGRARIYLQLAPGESLIVRTAAAGEAPDARWPYRQPAGAPVPLEGTWTIDFVKGGPTLPPSITTTSLASWTDLGGEEAQRFGGTARYRLEFDASPGDAVDWMLDLGDVRESARVRLNGHDVATVWSLPFRVRVGEHLRPGRNVLEIDVTNLAANRIRDMDRRKARWKIMREINIVDINYKPFDASGWRLTPSGLLGPVTLQPLRHAIGAHAAR